MCFAHTKRTHFETNLAQGSAESPEEREGHRMRVDENV